MKGRKEFYDKKQKNKQMLIDAMNKAHKVGQKNKMKAKLIKTDIQYRLHNEEGIIIATSHDGKLSKQNCDEIFGIVDVDNLDRKIRGLMMINGTSNGTIDHPNTDKMISLFNKAMELNKDKVFTREDIEEAFAYGQLNQLHNQKYFSGSKTYIQSLQQPTEIDVEIVTERDYSNRSCDNCCLSDDCVMEDGSGRICITRTKDEADKEYWSSQLEDESDYDIQKPVFDSEGQLILKKK